MKIISRSVSDSLKIGRAIAKNLKAGDIVCLFGQLGSGKTVLTKGMAQGLGIKKDKIISPSFVLIREYPEAKLPLYHFDLYRLKKAKEILALGYEEYLYGNGISVIEWADRLKSLLPKNYLKIELVIKTDTQRILQFKASGQRYQKLIRGVYEDIRH